MRCIGGRTSVAAVVCYDRGAYAVEERGYGRSKCIAHLHPLGRAVARLDPHPSLALREVEDGVADRQEFSVEVEVCWVCVLLHERNEGGVFDLVPVLLFS